MLNLLPAGLLIIGWLMLWLFFMNRNSPKIIEVTIVMAGIILGALIYITKEQTIEKKITTAYFVDFKETNLLAFPKIPIRANNDSASLIFSQYRRKLFEQKKELPFSFSGSHKPFVELHMAAIMNHLMKWYHNHWYVERTLNEYFTGTSEESSREIPNSITKNDIVKHTKEKLPNTLKNNTFFQDIFLPSNELALPKGTKIIYTIDEGDAAYAEFRFYKPHSVLRFINMFDIRIQVRLRHLSKGLGELGHYIGYTEREAKTDNQKNENLMTIFVLTDCNAVVSRWFAWHPSVVKYVEWINILFNDLYENFDWHICEQKIKDHLDILANEKIIYR